MFRSLALMFPQTMSELNYNRYLNVQEEIAVHMTEPFIRARQDLWLGEGEGV